MLRRIRSITSEKCHQIYAQWELLFPSLYFQSICWMSNIGNKDFLWWWRQRTQTCSYLMGCFSSKLHWLWLCVFLWPFWKLCLMTQSSFPAAYGSPSTRECFAVLWHLTFAYICSGPSAAKSADIIDFCVTRKLDPGHLDFPLKRSHLALCLWHVKWLLNSVPYCSFSVLPKVCWLCWYDYL